MINLTKLELSTKQITKPKSHKRRGRGTPSVPISYNPHSALFPQKKLKLELPSQKSSDSNSKPEFIILNEIGVLSAGERRPGSGKGVFVPVEIEEEFTFSLEESELVEESKLEQRMENRERGENKVGDVVDRVSWKGSLEKIYVFEKNTLIK